MGFEVPCLVHHSGVDCIVSGRHQVGIYLRVAFLGVKDVVAQHAHQLFVSIDPHAFDDGLRESHRVALSF